MKRKTISQFKEKLENYCYFINRSRKTIRGEKLKSSNRKGLVYGAISSESNDVTHIFPPLPDSLYFMICMASGAAYIGERTSNYYRLSETVGTIIFKTVNIIF